MPAGGSSVRTSPSVRRSPARPGVRGRVVDLPPRPRTSATSATSAPMTTTLTRVRISQSSLIGPTRPVSQTPGRRPNGTDGRRRGPDRQLAGRRRSSSSRSDPSDDPRAGA
ncbi:hypothetical protein [Ornithinimicrobium kibberense]|uniref:hypothetical protein n=1 Tax=Ornithinimicrobium kibberense TaxID=282060 RepID=UPI00360D00E6